MEYVLVAQDECQVEHFMKQAYGGWLLSETNRLDDTLPLSSIECTLLLSDVYEKVQFPVV
jgi:Uma2 family endonuclease